MKRTIHEKAVALQDEGEEVSNGNATPHEKLAELLRAFVGEEARDAGRASLSPPPPPCHAAADLCENVWRRRMAPALSTTYMVGRALLKYVKEQRRVPVLEVLVRFLNVTKSRKLKCTTLP